LLLENFSTIHYSKQDVGLLKTKLPSKVQYDELLMSKDKMPINLLVPLGTVIGHLERCSEIKLPIMQSPSTMIRFSIKNEQITDSRWRWIPWRKLCEVFYGCWS